MPSYRVHIHLIAFPAIAKTYLGRPRNVEDSRVGRMGLPEEMAQVTIMDTGCKKHQLDAQELDREGWIESEFPLLGGMNCT